MLSERTLDTLAGSGAKRLVIGFSGGIDSHALLHALASSGVGVPLHALHINHGISAFADAWQAHCAGVCDTLGVSYTAIRVTVAPGSGVEARARDARYEAFISFLEPDDLLLLAHHADDQAETILLGLFRGSNKPGLSGMPRERAIGRSRLMRPLLDIDRASIESYASRHDLVWIADQSNDDLDMNRNYIRHRVLPVIEARWPNAAETLLRSLDRDEQSRQLIDLTGEKDVSSMISPLGGLPVSGLGSLSAARRKNAVRYWIESLQLPVPGEAVLSAGLDSLLKAGDDATPLVTWQQVCLRRHQGIIYLTSPVPAFDATCYFCFDDGATIDTGAGVLTAEKVKGRGLAVCDLSGVTVRFRSGGERIRIRRNRTLKHVFQEAGMPVWLRDCLPLVYNAGHLVAVPGLPAWGIAARVASGSRPKAEEFGFEFAFRVTGHPYIH